MLLKAFDEFHEAIRQAVENRLETVPPNKSYALLPVVGIDQETLQSAELREEPRTANLGEGKGSVEQRTLDWRNTGGEFDAQFIRRETVPCPGHASNVGSKSNP